MRNKFFMMLFVLISLSYMVVAVNEYTREANLIRDVQGNVYNCKSLILPDKELWEKCESEGLIVVQKIKDGCVVGYECGEATSLGSCADIAPPSNEFCNECHSKNMIVKKNIVNGCVRGYVCTENLYMSPSNPIDECVFDVRCPPVKPAYDIVNSCESRGGVFTVKYNEKCEAIFECNMLSANTSNNTIGCPIVDVPSDISSKCKEMGASVVIQYDPNCNFKFFCKYYLTNNTQNNTHNITSNNTWNYTLNNYTGNITWNTTLGSTGLAQSVDINCQVDPELIKEFNSLVKELREKKLNAASEREITELKSKISRLNALIQQEKRACSRSNVVPPQTGLAVGIRCSIPNDLKEKLDDAWNNYRQLLKSPNDVDLDSAKNRINQITLEIQEYRKKCMAELVPGNVDVVPGSVRAACEIPDALLKELESLYKQYDDLQKSMQPSQQQLEDIKKKIDSLENRLIVLRARCNKLPVDNSTNISQISQYYAGRLSELVSSDPSLNIERLKELRSEIDETIKDLIAQRRQVRLKEISELVDNVRVTPNSVGVGNSFIESKGVSIETEVDGSVVSVSSQGDHVLINQDGLSVSTNEVVVSEQGLSVGESEIITPGRLLQVKTLQRNKDRIRELSLVNIENRMVYNARVDAKKKVLGIIPATARQEVVVDASTGEIIKEDKPWWSAISTDAK
ncbi:MAG: hypothetical protein KatS3mg002_0660 [Candidatus Woesearchaeota archaeon]|nr:MAG: hypothetical protein KatS3mg002_0660 [Candidatus Woesearchaeota archaeon]